MIYKMLFYHKGYDMRKMFTTNAIDITNAFSSFNEYVEENGWDKADIFVDDVIEGGKLN